MGAILRKNIKNYDLDNLKEEGHLMITLDDVIDAGYFESSVAITTSHNLSFTKENSFL